MPIISSDKFQYFQPNLGVENVAAGRLAAAEPRELVRTGNQGILAATDEVNRAALDFMIHVRNTQVDDDIQTHTMQAMREVQEKEFDFLKDPDYRTMPSRFAAELEQIARVHEEEITDPQVAQAFRQKFAILSANRTQAMQWQSLQREMENQEANVLNNFQEALNLIGGSRTDQEIDLHRKDFIASIDRKVENGMIKADWGASMKIRFNQSAAAMLVEQDLFVDAGMTTRKLLSTEALALYPGLTEEKRIDYLRLAREKFQQEENQRVIQEDRIERQKDKAQKQQQEDAYGGALVMYSRGRLNETIIQGMIERREIDPDKGDHLINRLREDGRREKKEENNPYVVGDLVRRLEMMDDIAIDLDKAMEDRAIKTETYLSLKKQAADQVFKRGLHYVNILRPGEADKYDPQRNMDYANAVENYINRVTGGEKPLEAAWEVVIDGLANKRSAFNRLPPPRFLEGERDNLSNLNKARIKTRQQFQVQAITPEEYRREIQVIDLLVRMKQENDRAVAVTEKENPGEAQRRLKKIKEAQR